MDKTNTGPRERPDSHSGILLISLLQHGGDRSINTPDSDRGAQGEEQYYRSSCKARSCRLSY